MIPLIKIEKRFVRRLMFWRWAYWLSFLLTLPAIAVAIRGIQEHRPWFLAILPVGTLFLFGYSSRKVNRFACPRCGQLFFDQQGPLGPGGTTLPPITFCDSCEWSYRP